MSDAVKILPHYTYSDYENWEGRWELIEGIPYAMQPLPIPAHQRIATKLRSELYIQFKNCSSCKVYRPLDYRIADDTILQPDMLVVSAEIFERYLDFPPMLVAEILSPATELKDRYTKLWIYESQAIPYYLIISPDNQEVEIYILKDKAYSLQPKGKNFQYRFSFGECINTVDFSQIW